MKIHKHVIKIFLRESVETSRIRRAKKWEREREREREISDSILDVKNLHIAFRIPQRFCQITIPDY